MSDRKYEEASVGKTVSRNMHGPSSKENGTYLYAIVSNSVSRIYGAFGINGGTVYTISDGDVAAVVSDVPNGKIRPERRHLAAHQEVLRRFMEESAVLPMSFGIIANGPNAVRKVLSRNRDAVLGQLERVAGKVEMGLRIAWDVPNIFEYFVNTHPELRAARDRFLGGRREPTREDKIEVGRMFDRILQEDREAHTETVEEILAPLCGAIKRNPPRDEREVANLACLVERDARKRFEDGVLEAARLFDNNFAFDFNGPWAPHNFVHVALEV